MITRRRLVQSAAAMGVVGLPVPVWSGTEIDLGGTTRIDTLSDGHLVLPGAFALGVVPVADAAPILSKYGLSTDRMEPECNVTLVRDGERIVLFDAGSGPNFMPTAGKLAEALEALSVDPSEVTHVVFTHAHPDHIWGVLDDFDEPVFANAAHMIGQQEWDYWMDPTTTDTIGEERLAFAAGALRMLTAIEDRVEFFEDGQEILPGIAARASFGHTPGHMSFEVRGGNSSAMIIGDAIGNHHLAFEAPQWPAAADQDADTGIATRLALLDQIATDAMQIVGFHLPQGGVGSVERAGDVYRFVPS